jgi:hypothetical protein
MPNPNPWERQPGETSRSYRAFQCYLNLAADRSIYRAALELARKKHGKEGAEVGQVSIAHWERWSSKYSWVDRARQWDDHLLEKARTAREAAILAELKDLKVDKAALENERIRFELRGHKSTERFFDGLEQKFNELVKLPSTKIKQQKLNEAGDVTELREIDGLRPTELARVVKQAMDVLSQGVNGNKKITRTERIGQQEAKAADGPPVPMRLIWGAWPDDEGVDESSSDESSSNQE